LLHVSQLGPGRINHANEVVKPGDEVSVRILTIDAPAQRISLSRLDPRGALLGSEEAAGSEEIEEVLNATESLGTNLGALFKKALDKKG
jgi:small subunit ribosomal protein S1